MVQYLGTTNPFCHVYPESRHAPHSSASRTPVQEGVDCPQDWSVSWVSSYCGDEVGTESKDSWGCAHTHNLKQAKTSPSSALRRIGLEDISHSTQIKTFIRSHSSDSQRRSCEGLPLVSEENVGPLRASEEAKSVEEVSSTCGSTARRAPRKPGTA